MSEQPFLDAQVVSAHFLSCSRAWVLSHPEKVLTPEEESRLNGALERLLEGEALPYIIGHWEFYGLDFDLTPHVLIPRPETELLVEQALKWLKIHPDRNRCADVGTGSGCIAISLALNHPKLSVVAIDRSMKALKVARRNVRKFDLENNIKFVQGDLLKPFSHPFDLICANLPYIPTSRLAKLDVSKREPLLALDGGGDGFQLIKRLLQGAAARLSKGGLLLAEIDIDQNGMASDLAGEIFPTSDIRVIPDLAGLPRLLRIE